MTDLTLFKCVAWIFNNLIQSSAGALTVVQKEYLMKLFQALHSNWYVVNLYDSDKNAFLLFS